MDLEILFVKTSSLGDIIQSFHALAQLKRFFPSAKVDWVVEKSFAPLVAAHPFVRDVIEVDFRSWKKKIFSATSWTSLFSQIKRLRKRRYDLLFDLQGNTKSGFLSLCSRAQSKVGFGPKSVREWPNLLATQKRFETDLKQNICLQYASLIERYFSIESQPITPFRLSISPEEKVALSTLPFKDAHFRVMVCPGSQWKNKQLEPTALQQLLQRMEKELTASFLLVWGNDQERMLCVDLKKQLVHAHVVEKLSLPAWQNLMWEVDLLIGVDSSALHLCSTTPTPTFSIFGPTSANIYKPEGKNHFSVQGACPYQVRFEKVCPRLRTCPTGACIRTLSGDALFQELQNRYCHKELKVAATKLERSSLSLPSSSSLD